MEDIYEPVSLFRDRFKSEFAENAAAFFEKLLKKSGVNEAENRETIGVIRQMESRISRSDNSRKNWKILRGVTIFLLVAAIVILAVFFLHLFSPEQVRLAMPVFVPLASGAILIGAIFLLVKKLNPKIRALKNHIIELEKSRAAEMDKAWKQMAPLNALYDWGMVAKLIQETVPRLELDPFFHEARLREFRENFGWNDTFNRDKSVIFAQSGEINGNPFALAETLNFRWENKTWSGSLDISWRELETYTDNKGAIRTRWVTRHQTLRAEVVKPAPNHTRRKFVIFANEAAPNLIFSRSPNELSDDGGNFFEKMKLNRAIKKLEKHSRNLDDDSNYTILPNREFEALFNATNRNNEIEFRLLFTPLAQLQMVKFLRNGTDGFGDNFYFSKNKMINTIYPAHLNNTDISASPALFQNYDTAAAREFFNNYSNEYFRAFYFAMAPLLTIPLYQQHRSHANIYKDTYGRTASFWEHESLANFHGQEKFRHPQSITENILKTAKSDTGEIHVTANGFRGIERTEYVEKYGGDGYLHKVPVHWTEYLPVQKMTPLAVRETDGLTYEDFKNHAATSEEWQGFFRENDTDLGRVIFRRSIAFIKK